MKGRSRQWTIAAAIAAVCALAFHRYLLSPGFDAVPGDAGDARAFVYFAEHLYQAWRGEAEVLSPAMFHPVKETLGYADPILAHSVPFTALRMAGADMFAALTATVVFFNLLNFISCFLLLNGALRLNAIAAAVGASFFAFSSPRVSHAGHYNLLAAFMLPVAIAVMIHFARNATVLTRRQGFLLLSVAALCFDLQLLVSLYMGWFFALWVVLFFMLAVVVRSSREYVLFLLRRFWPSIAGAAVVMGAGLAPVISLYLPVQSVVGPRPYGIVHVLTPDGWSLLRMPPGNFVWGDVASTLSRMNPPFSAEHNIGLGLVASFSWIILTGWAARTAFRAVRVPVSRGGLPDGRVILALVILATSAFYAIGMRYGDFSPWRLVYLIVPGADGLRGVARYVLLLALPMAIVFSVVIDRVLHRVASMSSSPARYRLGVMAAAIVAFGLLEQFGAGSTVSRSAQLSRLGRLASELPPHCSSFYAAPHPLRRPAKYEYQIDAMLISAMRRVPTLNGYSGHVPPGWALREVEAVDYEDRVARWISRHRLPGPVCRLEIGD